MAGRAIQIHGVVQGVGFRPTVWRLAREHQLVGSVWNDAGGVTIHAWGEASQIDHLLQQLRDYPPPLATIDTIESTPLDAPPPEQFTITESQTGGGTTGVAADAASCSACIAEVMDPENRRYRYPFTNCTHCGPRLSITRATPYDRRNTSMAPFPLCEACRQEYDDPADRRFHAQPTCCPDCGPRLWLEERQGRIDPPPDQDPVQLAAQQIRGGAIVAIQGVGGFHLACDATDEAAVSRLRERKGRPSKPLAVMVHNLESLLQHGNPSKLEIALLEDPAAPIVLVQKGREPLAPSVAPNQSTIGFLLPYSPLHHLLMAALQQPIVLTSGNHSSNPQCIDHTTAHRELQGVADYWLLHDREIINRVDDSVVRIESGAPSTLRVGRGIAPLTLPLPEGLESAPPLLAMGGELKNSFALLHGGQVTLSQYLGNLGNGPTFHQYLHALQQHRQLFDHHPVAIAVDRHPGYRSTQQGRATAEQEGLPLIEVQHHHAHLASVMIEHRLPLNHPPLLGIILDGIGYGESGQIWGGEFLLANYGHSTRLATIRPVALAGGELANRQPWRNLLAHLDATLGWEEVAHSYPNLEMVRYLKTRPIQTITQMIRQGINSPAASSSGRLFDAVAAATALCREQTSYEGEAAQLLENRAEPWIEQEQDNGYPVRWIDEGELQTIEWGALWRGILEDLAAEVDPGIIAARFHAGLINALCETAERLCLQHGINRVVLGGGVFQNQLLLGGVSDRLQEGGVSLYRSHRLPSNDQGIAAGQCAIAAATLLKSGAGQAPP